MGRSVRLWHRSRGIANGKWGWVGGVDTFSVAPLGLWCWVMQACYTHAALLGLKFYGNLLWGFYHTFELTLHSAGVQELILLLSIDMPLRWSGESRPGDRSYR